MEKKTRQVLTSIGSVLVLAPSTSYSAHVPTLSSDQRMQQVWQRTGQQLQEAMKQHKNQVSL